MSALSTSTTVHQPTFRPLGSILRGRMQRSLPRASDKLSTGAATSTPTSGAHPGKEYDPREEELSSTATLQDLWADKEQPKRKGSYPTKEMSSL